VKIKHEIGQIDDLLESFGPLLAITRTRDPDLVERSALATVLHSFYNGIENIFSIVAKQVDGRLPDGSKWHRDLLIQMSEQNNTRQAIIDSEQYNVLLQYLSFRHYFRHSYSYRLDWTQMRSLVIEIEVTWRGVKDSIQAQIAV
jgi:hypothetical protein